MFKSRKLGLTLIALGLATAGFVLCGIFAPLQAVYGTFLAFLSAMVAIYGGSNVAQKVFAKEEPLP